MRQKTKADNDFSTVVRGIFHMEYVAHPSLEWGKSLKTFTFVYAHRFPKSRMCFLMLKQFTVLQSIARDVWRDRAGEKILERDKGPAGGSLMGYTEDRPPSFTHRWRGAGPPRSDGKPQRTAFKGKDEDSGVWVSSLSSGNETWPVAAVEEPCISLTSPVPWPDTHTDLICFPGPCGDWNTYISIPQTNTPSNCWISFTGFLHASSEHTLSFPHLTFSHSSQKWVKGGVSVVWLKWALSTAFSISHSCVKAFLSSFPCLFFLFSVVERQKRKINTFGTFCLGFITQPQSGPGESAKS